MKSVSPVLVPSLVMLPLFLLFPPQPCSGGDFVDTGSLITARSGHTATLLPSGKVLVAGGSHLASAEVYDPASGTWTATGSLGVGRSGHTATLLTDGRVLVVGGYGSSNYLASAEVYDPANGTWTATGSLGVERSGHTATLLLDGRVLIAGGENMPFMMFPQTLGSAELYDPITESWTPTGSLPHRASHRATLLPNGKVLAAGGFQLHPTVVLASASLYDSTSGIWTDTGDLGVSREGPTATLLPAGEVLVVGGTGDFGPALASAELYDPITESWTPTGSLATTIFYHTATLLPDGKVLAVGAGGVDGAAALYSPASGTWAATSSPNHPRAYHTATLLPDGRVLVAGGAPVVGGVPVGGILGSAELYVETSTATTLGNISTRLNVGLGDNAMIGGFIITGTQPKRVIVRAIGPSLGVVGALADPALELHKPDGTTVTNDNWRDNQEAEIEATGLPPSNDLESAIVATLPANNSAYTAIARGKDAGTGIGLVEVYDIDRTVDSQLANISTRGFIDTGNNVMIGGFILGSGSTNASVAVRGIGPSLSQVGLNNLLADPTLELRDSNGELLVANDNWQDDAVSAAQLNAHGLALQDSLESGIWISLSPGAYTAILAGNNGSAGIGLVEIYNIQ